MQKVYDNIANSAHIYHRYLKGLEPKPFISKINYRLFLLLLALGNRDRPYL